MMSSNPHGSPTAPCTDTIEDTDAQGSTGQRPHRSPGGARVRSFVLRSGRLTPGQARAVRDHWPRYGVDGPALRDIAGLFGNTNPVTLEIGFGAGDALVHAAMKHPGRNYLGIEVYEPGIGRVLKAAHDHGLTNLRVWRGDATDALDLLPDRSLESIWIFFPDPWPKKRHRKRRLVSRELVRVLGRKLAGGGRILLATDWEEYATEMLGALDTDPDLENCAGLGNFADPPIERIETRFARRARRLGHGSWDLCFRRRRLSPVMPPVRNSNEDIARCPTPTSSTP